MADTLPNITLPINVWVDLYAATGITVGTEILAQNIGVTDIYLYAGATAPLDDTAHQIIKRSQFAINDEGDSGAWAYSLCEKGLVNIRIPT